MEKLKEKLYKKKISQEKLSEILGLSTVTINKKINKKIEFTCSEVAKIKIALGLSIAEVEEIFLQVT